MGQKTQNHSGKLGAFIGLIVGLIKNDMSLVDNPGLLKAHLSSQFPELKIKDRCPNCDASMKEYIYSLDTFDALLLTKMAIDVRSNQRKGHSFTMSNQVRVPDLPTSHTVKCRTTRCRKLGLVAPVLGNNKKPIPGLWLVTRRGWQALAGERVPKYVKVWRNKIEEKFSDETTTLSEALNNHLEHVKRQKHKGRLFKEDHTEDVKAYKPTEWFEYYTHDGKLF